MVMTAVTKHARASRYVREKFLLVLFAASQTVASEMLSRQTTQRTMTSRSGLFRRETIDTNDLSGVVTGNDITVYDVVNVRSSIECASHCVNVNCVGYVRHNQLCEPVSISVLKC